MDIVFRLALVILFVFLNGFFVASEFALVGVRKTRIQTLIKQGNKSAEAVSKALDQLDHYISSTQLGITIASIALGWIGEPALAHIFLPLFSFLPDNAAVITSHTVAVILAFSIITFLHIVFGELAPKTIALQTAEKTALTVIRPLDLFTKIFSPFIWILNSTGNLVLKPFGYTSAHSSEGIHTEEEIKLILAQSAENGTIEKNEAEMMFSAFRFGDIPVKQIMMPRTEIIAFNVATTLQRVIKSIEKNPHSRFPVYEQTLDTVIGFIHIKDIYKEILKDKETDKLSQTSIIREILFVPENQRIDDVLLLMRRKRIHIAVVNDEFGGTAGIVTMEDVIESLVGEIEDEFEKPTADIRKQKDGSFLVNGLTPIDRVKKYFNIPIQGQGYTTIGGLVFGLLGHQPIIGDTVQIGNIKVTVEVMERRRIDRLRIVKEKKKIMSN